MTTIEVVPLHSEEASQEPRDEKVETSSENNEKVKKTREASGSKRPQTSKNTCQTEKGNRSSTAYTRRGSTTIFASYSANVINPPNQRADKRANGTTNHSSDSSSNSTSNSKSGTRNDSFSS